MVMMMMPESTNFSVMEKAVFQAFHVSHNVMLELTFGAHGTAFAIIQIPTNATNVDEFGPFVVSAFVFRTHLLVILALITIVSGIVTYSVPVRKTGTDAFS